jgi:hypothetical protein
MQSVEDYRRRAAEARALAARTTLLEVEEAFTAIAREWDELAQTRLSIVEFQQRSSAQSSKRCD